MSLNQLHFDPLESALLETERVDRAGVFRPTPVSARHLLRGKRVLHSTFFRMKWVASALAACLALTVTAWVWLGTNGLPIAGPSPGVENVPARPGEAKHPFVNCLTGPLAAAGGVPCDVNDMDGDGDIDLADFSLSQLGRTIITQ